VTALVFDGVSLRRGDTDALVDVSLSFEAGERIAIVGPSGAGKSTLLALANTSLRPTTGTVRVLDADPTGLDQRARRHLRSRIGTVHQRLLLPGSLRVVHNVNAGRLGTWSRRRAMRSLIRPAARDVERARDALDRLGVADKLWTRTDELSGGERQRVALARLLVQDAELVLADEPTASLDPARAREVIELLLAVADTGSSRTLIVALHDVGLALGCFDRVVALRAGRVEFDRPTADVDEDALAHLYLTAGV
jgi:phosphonate transport system ATP-binding protein